MHSISAGDDNNALGGGQQNPLDRLRDWDDKLLVDDFDGIWRLLMTSNGNREVEEADIIPITMRMI